MTDDDRIRQIEIDWVEIPEGEFLTGISKEQRAMLRERLWAELKLDEMEPPRRQFVESLAQKLQRAARDQSYDLKKELTKEERRVREMSMSTSLGNVLWAMKELERQPDQHTDRTKLFYIARFPITKRQAEIFYDSDFARRFRLDRLRLTRGDDHLPDMPESIFWMVSDAFAHWLGGRLPTTREWEKAARGTDGRLYPWGDEWDPSKGNFGLLPPPERPGGLRTPIRVVSDYPEGQSPFAVWDMVGNGQEWTALEMYGPKLKGYAYNGPDPAFYFCLPVRTEDGWVELDGVGTYRKNIGFRPVLDEWVHEVWAGFRSQGNAQGDE